MKTTEQKLQAIRQEIESLPFGIRAAWCNHSSIRMLLDEKRRQLLTEFSAHQNPNILDPNSLAYGVRVLGVISASFAELQALVNLIESTQEWKETEKTVKPLLSKLAELEKQLADEREACAQAEQYRREKLEAAKAEAIARIESEFATA